ncbi:hypothetical protein RCG19_06140 [Neobacillus sp. OS1-2]|uniref:hypothetical protein n=1 Tax=Neobacillus sp. OS1-2 TaxID=3070680 RepID=UPI0027DFF43D|nr:hypothetical protein [Neobacillus sp. OS1-2]WML41232.1 hypothetical protein RCG19_06140 [Neobacillus sp. OS1-2]
MFKDFKLQKSMSIGELMTALFLSLIMADSLFKAKGRFLLHTFDGRVISEASIAGIDIASRTSIFYQVVVIGTISFLFGLFLQIMIRTASKKLLRASASGSVFIFETHFFHTLSLFGVITFVFKLFGVESKTTINLILYLQLIIFCILILKLFATKFEWTRISQFLSEKYFGIWLFLQPFVITFYSEYFGKGFFEYQTGNLSVNYFFGFVINFLFIFVVFSLVVRKNKLDIKQAMGLISISSFPIFISPLYLPLANEMYLILNQNEVFIFSPHKILFILIVISILGAGIIYLIGKRKAAIAPLKSVLSNFYYPMLLVMLTAILFQPPKTIGPPIELFESGNPGVAVDQFFKYGKIPILETFNAHALSELVAPFLYSIINGYQGWESFLYNTVFDKTIYFLIGYFFLRKLISSELALLTLGFFPLTILSSQLLPEYYIMGIIAVFALHKLMKKPSFNNYLLFFFVLFFTFLWRFDIGASAIPAAVISLVLYFTLYKKRWHIKEAILAGVCTGGLLVLAFILLAISKDVPIIFRSKELLSVVSSNQIWGFSTLGDNHKLNYSLFYIITPSLSVLLFCYLIVRTKWVEKIHPIMFTSISFLLLFTLFNFPRGLVRHSLVENTALFILGFTAIPLAYLPYLIKSKGLAFHHFIKFSAIGIAYSFVILGTMYGTKIEDQSLIGKTMDRFITFSDYIAEDKKVNRYPEPEEYKIRTYGALKGLFDLTMEPHETFIDFSNAPFLYVHTNRETPMYINQTPAFLSDEISQNSFLKEIQAYSVPFVVFAAQRGFLGIDGVPNHIRSYRVSEYIFNRYTPFVTLNGFDVWVSKDKKSTIENKIKHLSQKINELSLYQPDNNNSKEWEAFDIKNIKETDKGTTFDTGNNDPQIQGIFDITGLENYQLKDDSKYELEIKYSTKKVGVIQIYYLLNGTYSDEDSSTIKINGPISYATTKVEIPYLGLLKNMRIDPPDNDRFVIHSIKLIEKPNQYKKITKSYNEMTNVGWVPYLWGEKDTLHAKDLSPVQVDLSKRGLQTSHETETFQINKSFDRKQGNYVHLKLKSRQIGDDFEAELKYGEDPHTDSSGYLFKIKADGEYHDYLIRVSSQYNWYLSLVKYASITSHQAIEIKKVEILKGD